VEQYSWVFGTSVNIDRLARMKASTIAGREWLEFTSPTFLNRGSEIIRS